MNIGSGSRKIWGEPKEISLDDFFPRGGALLDRRQRGVEKLIRAGVTNSPQSCKNFEVPYAACRHWDVERKGPTSRGKEPRAVVKVSKQHLSVQSLKVDNDHSQIGLEAAMLYRKRNSS